MAAKEYDFLVIGAGSGGIASARKAASYGARVAVIESNRLGGTCVNLGCVPKKIMWNTASVMESLREAVDCGLKVQEPVFDWAALKAKRDMYIAKLNGIYEVNLMKDGIDIIQGLETLFRNGCFCRSKDSHR